MLASFVLVLCIFLYVLVPTHCYIKNFTTNETVSTNEHISNIKVKKPFSNILKPTNRDANETNFPSEPKINTLNQKYPSRYIVHKHITYVSAKKTPFEVVVMIKISNSWAWVEGTLISKQHVLTGEYMEKFFRSSGVIEYNTVGVYAGSGDDFLNETETKIYPSNAQWRLATSYYFKKEASILILMVKEKFDLTSFVKPIRITREPWRLWEKRNCIAVGHGGLQHSMEYKRRKIYSLEIAPCWCQPWFRHGYFDFMVCNYPKHDNSVCGFNDMGAGLICDDELVALGLPAYAVKDIDNCQTSQAADQECYTRQYVSPFVRLLPYIDWIEDIISKSTQQVFVKAEVASSTKVLAVSCSRVVLTIASIKLTKFFMYEL